MEYETLYCVKPHTYNGKYRLPGEAVQVRRKHSAVLIALGRMSRSEPNVVPFPIPAPVVDKIDAEAHTVDFIDDLGNDGAEDVEAVRKSLRAEYEALFGRPAHGRMSVERLREEISKKNSEES